MATLVVDWTEAAIKAVAHEKIEPASECERNLWDSCWFMTPKEHAEYLVAMPIVMGTLAYGFMKLSGDKLGFDTKITEEKCPPYPVYWKAILVFFLLYLGLKWDQPWRLISSALAPCNFVHLVNIITVFTSNPQVRYHIPRWSLHYLAFVLAPIAFPDTRTLSQIETCLFFGVHYVVPAFLLYTVATGRVDPLKQKVSTALGLFCVTIIASSTVQTWMSFLLANNVNYQLYPAPAFMWLREHGWKYKWGGIVFSLFMWILGCTILNFYLKNVCVLQNFACSFDFFFNLY